MKKYIFILLILCMAALNSGAQCIMTLNTNYTVPETCMGMCNGIVDFAYTNATGTVNYTFNPAAPGATQFATTFYNLCPGNYTVTATDGVGCTATTIFNIMPAIPMTLSCNTTATSCTACTGSIASVNFGGTAPYSYTIQPGNQISGSNIFSNLCAGTYTILVTDANGCLSSTVAAVTMGPPLTGVTLNDVVYDESCYLSGDGSIDLQPTPAAGLTYYWSTGDTSQDLSNVVSGPYWVSVSDGTNCSLFYDTVHVAGINCGTINGKAWIDSVGDCVYNTGDHALSASVIQLSNGALAYPNMNGDFQFTQVPLGSYTISKINPYWFGGFVPDVTCVQAQNLSLTSTNTVLNNVDFIDSSLNQVDLFIWAYTSQYVPGSTSSIKIYPNKHTYALPVNGVVSLLLNDSLNYASAVPAPNSVIATPNGDSITWIIPMTYYSGYSWTNPPIEVMVNTPSTYSMGLSLQSSVSVQPQGLTDLWQTNNTANIVGITATSFDPNDKTVSPRGMGPIGGIWLHGDSVMEYIVRFQNTGTASATNIRILDTLSGKLDISTLRIIGSSHNYLAQVHDGHILDLYFKDIMLPDSNSNEPGSHGFIAYSIEQISNIQVWDEIKNTASIYFDYNAPIQTNTTLNTIIIPGAVDNLGDANALKVYPQPAHDLLYVQVPDENIESVALYDMQGRMIRSVKPSSVTSEYKWSITGITSGIYQLKLKTVKGNYSRMVTIE
ncbi:MAG: T9SS type A sorting domain-containing protein [Chitinophagaceae bacterium]|nr:T9SS type A sorting domain-containing protein [Chitinophagaceae bacterium]